MQKAVPVAAADSSEERLKFAQEYLQLAPQAPDALMIRNYLEELAQ